MQRTAEDQLREAEEDLLAQEEADAGITDQPSMEFLFEFIRQPAAISRWLTCSIFATLLVLLTHYLVSQAIADTVQSTFMALLALIAITLVSIGFATFLSACLLGIVRDTANGGMKVESWPDAAFMEWFVESFFIVNAFFIACAPGACLVVALKAVGGGGIASVILVALSAFACFPIALASLLTNESMVNFICPAIWYTLRKRSNSWGAFYGGAIFLLVAAGLVCLIGLAGMWAQTLAAAILVAAAMVYARLFGWLLQSIGSAVVRYEERRAA